MRYLLAVLLLSLFALPAHAFPSPVSGSYYHSKFDGRPMACGGRFSNERLTAASNHHPCGTQVRVQYRNRSVVVRVTDRCGRCGIDLSRAAARELGLINVGRARVHVERISASAGREAGLDVDEVQTYADKSTGGDAPEVRADDQPEIGRDVDLLNASGETNRRDPMLSFDRPTNTDLGRAVD